MVTSTWVIRPPENDEVPVPAFLQSGPVRATDTKVRNVIIEGGVLSDLPIRNNMDFGSEVYGVASKEASVHQHGKTMSRKQNKNELIQQKRRRNDEVEQYRRTRVAKFETHSGRGLDGERFNQYGGWQPGEQGILGGAPAAQLWDRGLLLDGHGGLVREKGILTPGPGPAPQFWEQGGLAAGPTLPFGDRGMLDSGHAFKEHGIFEGRPTSLHRELSTFDGFPPPLLRKQGGLPGVHSSQLMEMGLLGRSPGLPSVSPDKWQMTDMRMNGRNGDQDQYHSAAMLMQMEHGILGGGPLYQSGNLGTIGGDRPLLSGKLSMIGEYPHRYWDHGMPLGLVSEPREQGVLGRGPPRPTIGSESMLKLEPPNNGRYLYNEHFMNFRAVPQSVQGLLGRMPTSTPV